ncbi:MAG: MTH938/NDUFAF3 family protein [Deltaproteobacteria bacterium]|nr:MTH938/NDUFAF3 family protein [Deltaproteobacteria bacterium]
MIDSFSFGAMVIDGHAYHSDLIIYPDGRIRDSWWRGRGHVLSMGDIVDLVGMRPKIIIAGTGVDGRMKPEKGLEKHLAEKGVQLMAGPNKKAVDWFNGLHASERVGACFHLSC